jgi:hypothetical protein
VRESTDPFSKLLHHWGKVYGHFNHRAAISAVNGSLLL